VTERVPNQQEAHAAGAARFAGSAARYDAHRPAPPSVIADILTQLAQVAPPELVVDLGCGTGLSTLLWVGRAAAVVGIEPSADMRHQAERRAARFGGANVRFQPGVSTATGLPDGCAAIVTCSQSLHWMDPQPTFAEAARVLRPGGVFAAYDCEWPPTLHWEVELAYEALLARAAALADERGLSQRAAMWPKREHLARMRASRHFRRTKEIALHHAETGGAARLVGLAASHSHVAALLEQGLSEAELGLETLRVAARRALGDGTVPWYWSYRMRIGVT
jgi:ubiquinone/menaquinone biosynthesis C-methylase UbiE